MTSPCTPPPVPVDGAQIHRGTVEIPGIDGVRGGLLLDLASGAQSLTESLDTLARMAGATLSQATGATSECAVVLHGGKHAMLAGTGTHPRELAALELELGEGPLTDALASGLPVAANHLSADYRWPQYRRHLRSAGYKSVLAVRLQLDGGQQSALAFFAARTAAFPQAVVSAGLGFADLASRSLRLVLELREARTSAADLRSALESRTSIDIACGVIMAQNRCSYREAFGIISKASSHRNIKLRKVAEDILDKLPDGAPRTHFDH
ncbi:MAG TPA: GAF and ANTAR domain-containing protein [Arthrobacter sp.]|nr:GAF and ANTAR domain-containing protein [Arthrobacter sp.]